MRRENFNLPLKVLRQISHNIHQQANQSTTLSPDPSYFKNNTSMAKIKSIYTETEQSRVTPTYTLETEYQQYEEEDIYEYLEKEKTLKQRIMTKLQKKKVNLKTINKQNKEATFRPSHRNIHQKNNNNKQNNHKHKNTGIKGQMLKLEFHERQKKTLERRTQAQQRIRTERSFNEVRQCTFKPKLTTYKLKKN